MTAPLPPLRDSPEAVGMTLAMLTRPDAIVSSMKDSQGGEHIEESR